MPRLEDNTEALLQAGEEANKEVRRFWDAFADFALRDNVLEVAVGLIIAAAFTAVVSSFVSDILLPPISLLPFIDKNLEEKFAVLRGGGSHARGYHYNTMKQALDDGAVVMAYGCATCDLHIPCLGTGSVLIGQSKVLYANVSWI